MTTWKWSARTRGTDRFERLIWLPTAHRMWPGFILFALTVCWGGPVFSQTRPTLADYVNCGLFTYPVLMAADILLYKATHVPVGEDQIQHLELTREVVRRFNNRFGPTFAEPMPLHKDPLRILGLDGKQKMSKSLGNYIAIGDNPDDIRKKISGAFTDETRLRKKDPGHPESCYVCGLQGYFSAADKVAELHDGCRSARIGCVESKRPRPTPIPTAATPTAVQSHHFL